MTTEIRERIAKVISTALGNETGWEADSWIEASRAAADAVIEELSSNKHEIDTRQDTK